MVQVDIGHNRRNESLNTIDTFSLFRIIPLHNHPIYSAGRRFAVYRWGIPENSDRAMENGVCEIKESSQDGKLALKVSTFLVEKSDCSQLTKPSCQQKKFH